LIKYCAASLQPDCFHFHNLRIKSQGNDCHRQRDIRLHVKREPAKAAIFAAHEELTSDPDLLEIAESAISKGKSAAFAWKKAFTTHADRLAGLRTQLLAQRANDILDVGVRVLLLLAGVEAKQPEYPLNSVLIAEDLTPSDTAVLDRSRVAGFCTTRGGATSHVAILARSLGLPALAINWGVLGGEGYVARNERVAEFLARQGTGALTPAEVTSLMESFLTGHSTQMSAIRVDWAKWRQSFRGMQDNTDFGKHLHRFLQNR